MNQQRPQRRVTDHIHQEYWRETDQHRHEDEITQRFSRIEQAIERLTNRITLLFGAIGLLLFVLPILAPFIRDFLGVGQ
jgi:uncharacterized membrane protein